MPVTAGSSDADATCDGPRRGTDIRIGATVAMAFSSAGRALLKIIPTASDTQHVRLEDIVIAGAAHRVELLGEDRVVVIDADAPVDVNVTYTGVTCVRRALASPRIIPDAHYTHIMHGQRLIPSRHCPSDRLAPTAAALCPDRMDPSLLERCREWVLGNLKYVPGSSDAMTSADETLLRREGICRDFAYLMIALLRGLGVPARFVAAYGPGVDPPDFHAVVEARRRRAPAAPGSHRDDSAHRARGDRTRKRRRRCSVVPDPERTRGGPPSPCQRLNPRARRSGGRIGAPPCRDGS